MRGRAQKRNGACYVTRNVAWALRLPHETRAVAEPAPVEVPTFHVQATRPLPSAVFDPSPDAVLTCPLAYVTVMLHETRAEVCAFSEMY